MPGWDRPCEFGISRLQELEPGSVGLNLCLKPQMYSEFNKNLEPDILDPELLSTQVFVILTDMSSYADALREAPSAPMGVFSRSVEMNGLGV